MTCAAPTSPSSPSSLPVGNPCFPSSSSVTLAHGTTRRLDALKEGDVIVTATAEGALTTDTVSLLSMAMPTASGAFLTLTTDANHTLTLTAEHHLPVGAACCSTLKKAKDVAVGDTVWGVQGLSKTASTTVTAISKADGAGLHSPVPAHGTFPIIDGLVTSFDAMDKIHLAKYGLETLLKTCKASGTCDIFKHRFLGGGRKYIGE